MWRFTTGKFGELSVSARHYRDLLAEADAIYPQYVSHIVGCYTMPLTYKLGEKWCRKILNHPDEIAVGDLE